MEAKYPIITEAIGRAWDAPSACYNVEEPESLIGVEITDLDGRLNGHMIGVFITCGSEGRKVFLTADQVRDLASSLTTFAILLDGGATNAGFDA